MNTQNYSHKLYIATTTQDNKVLDLQECVDYVNYTMEFSRIDCYSLTVITGYWKTIAEKTIVVEVIDTLEISPTIEVIAQKAKVTFEQEAVLYTKQLIDCTFI